MSDHLLEARLSRVSFHTFDLGRPLAVIDLESTGTDPATDRVVEVAVLTLALGISYRAITASDRST